MQGQNRNDKWFDQYIYILFIEHNIINCQGDSFVTGKNIGVQFSSYMAKWAKCSLSILNHGNITQ